MKKIKEKKGSIVIGMMLLVIVIIFLFVFAYETALLLITKQKSDNIAKNISSSLILNIDKDKAVRHGIIDIDKEKGEQIAQKILDESYAKSDIFTEPTMEITYKNNDFNEVHSTVTTSFKLKKNMVFYKNTVISSRSEYRAYTGTNSPIIDEICDNMCSGMWNKTFKDACIAMCKSTLSDNDIWGDIWNSIVFEEVFD